MVDVALLPKHMRLAPEASIAKARVYRESLSPEEIHEAAARRMAIVDSLSQPLRFLVHEFGFSIIREYLRKNWSDAEEIRQDILSQRFIRELDLEL